MSIFVTAIDGMTSHTAADASAVDTALLSQEGVIGKTANDLLVEAQDTPDMTIKVSPGSCYVLRDSYVANDNTIKHWQVIVTAETNVTIPTADGANDRIDLICVKIDTGASPDATASNVATLVNVEGTPAGSPSAPAVPNNHLKLAEIAVGAGVSVINSGNITDSRTYIGLSLPHSEGYRFRDTGGNVDAQVYEDTAGNLIIKSSKSGAEIRINPVSEKVEVKKHGTSGFSTISTKTLQGYVVEATANTATGDGQHYFTIRPSMDGLKLTAWLATVITAGTTNTLDIQVHNLTKGVDMFATVISVDSGEVDSSDPATPAVVDTDNNVVNTGDRIRVDIDAVHSTPAKGLIVDLDFN